MTRLTRVEQRARTRAAVLAAARERFLAVGYAAASLDEIAERAGYSKGAVYSNFHDKPNLCRAVLEEIHADKLSELGGLTTGEQPLGARLEAVGEWIERTAGDVGWTMLELEFVTVSRDDPVLAGMVVELRRDAQRTVMDLLSSLLDAAPDPVTPGGADTEDIGPIEVLDDESALDLAGIADLLLSAGIGLGIQRAIDPTVAVGPTVEVMRGALALLGAGS